MTITTRSVFYYDLRVTANNFNLDFSEGGGELTAKLRLGSYTHTSFPLEVARALTEVGSLVYSASVNRDTRRLTISSAGNFEIKTTSGSHQGLSGWSLVGFEGADKTGSSSYLSDLAIGKEYLPTSPLQKFTPPEHFIEFADATINESNTEVEVFTTGKREFMEFALEFVTDNQMGNSFFETRVNAVSELCDILNYFITKGPFEFMRDRDTRSSFETFLLESTPTNRKGVGFKLQELINKKMAGYFETKTLKFRKIS